MVKRCSWGTCNTDDRYPERLEGGVKFIPFPKPATNLEKCKRWIKLCGRPKYQLNEDLLRDRNKSKHFYVCTKHFVDGGPSEKYPDPKSALGHGRVTMSRPAPKKRQSPDCSDNTPEPKKLSVEIRVFENGQTEVQQTQEDSTVVPTDNSVVSEDCQPGKESVECNDINSLDVLAMAAEKRKLEEVIISLQEENNKLKCEQMHLQDSVSNKSSMRYANLKTEEFKYYTGFSSATFNVIYQFLVPVDEPFEYSKNVSSLRILSMKDQLLFVLIKLRQNFDFKHMSRLFGISPQDCNVIFSSWINFMFYRFGSVPIWPDRSIIIDKMPQKFKEEFPTTLVIIDGTEVKIQRPSSLTKQSQFYSDYKSSTTLKGLVGIDPRGSIIFASMLFSGSISDNDITHQSGFFKILKEMIKEGKIHEGDGVMADKGFRIENDLEKIGLKLNIPPFAPASGQMKTSDVKMTEKVAIHRVHVERAIARVKKFKIMDNRIDLSLFSAINQIWFVCCFLTNFMPFLIQD